MNEYEAATYNLSSFNDMTVHLDLTRMGIAKMTQVRRRNLIGLGRKSIAWCLHRERIVTE